MNNLLYDPRGGPMRNQDVSWLYQYRQGHPPSRVGTDLPVEIWPCVDKKVYPTRIARNKRVGGCSRLSLCLVWKGHLPSR